MAVFYGGKSWEPFLLQELDVKPGKTYKIVLGGDGHAVKGRIMVPTEELSKVDWQFARVESQPSAPEFVALPAMTAAAEKPSSEIARRFRS